MPKFITVHLILDPEYSGPLSKFGSGVEAWIVDTRHNRKRVENYWSKCTSADRATLFKITSPLNMQTCMQLLETIDDHYENSREHAHVRFLKIIGRQKDEFWREALMDLGWQSLETEPHWSSFERKAP